MPFDAGSAVGRMSLDVSGYVSGILQAQAISAVMPQVVTNFLANPLLAVIGIAQDAARAVAGIFIGATDAADDMADMAANAGVAVETLSGLGMVAKKNGADVGAMADAFKFLGRNQGDAIAGGPAALKLFEDLGVAFQNADGSARSLDEMIFEVGDALAALPSAGERTTKAMDILGRSGTTLMAMFQQGSGPIRDQIAGYERMGAVITESTARSAGMWNDMMDDLGAAWQGFKQMLAEPIRSALMPMLENLLNWVTANPQTIQAVISEMAQTIASVLDVVGSTVLWVIQNFEILATVLGGVVAAAIGGKVVSAIWTMISALQKASIAQAILLSLSGPKGWFILAGAAVTAGTAIAGISNAFDKAAEAADEYQAKAVNSAAATAKAATSGAGGVAGRAGQGPAVNVGPINLNVDPKAMGQAAADAVRKKLESQPEMLEAAIFREMVGRGL